MPETIVLAYSGGLDTSVATKWLQEERGYDVVCMMADLGRLPDIEDARARGLGAGAKAVHVVDARDDFLRYFVFPALAAGAVYEGAYPARHGPRKAADREAARRQGARGRGHRCRPRLHGQGQRPGAL